MTRDLIGVVGTTDVHSHLSNAPTLAAALTARRSNYLVVDSGDIFEGTGYYQAGAGQFEARLLTLLYDAIVPGNHGYRHYRTPELESLVVCANVITTDSTPVWEPVQVHRISGRTVAVTGIISPSAWACVPADEREGHQVLDPADTLRDLAASTPADEWVILSHSGFEADLALMNELPEVVGVVFAGHCHSTHSGPTNAGSSLVVKGPELGEGYAVARLEENGWRCLTDRLPLPSSAPVADPQPGELARLLTDIEAVRAESHVVAVTASCYRGAVPDRGELTHRIGQEAHRRTGHVVLLNETALRSARVGPELTVWDLAELDPFDNHLVSAELPQPLTTDMVGDLVANVGPVNIAPRLPTPAPNQVVTTGYLATTHLRAQTTTPTGLSVRDLLIHEMTAPPGGTR
ncbi:metallophosphoesterase [Nocardiopsis sp. LDBS1602]|uniref:metallophosphoesterase n=1 Tax=Nocardiopsis sp. LDBS1602 TaxID=3109597 RepID=UPI002DB6E8BA|nr:metallophosphoesterase [Nocardiopsis sp. LDBS1602]MEC3891827.1 metallophosphoesterase [Nocardiopsis sp. LDBS1602]